MHVDNVVPISTLLWDCFEIQNAGRNNNDITPSDATTGTLPQHVLTLHVLIFIIS